MGINRYRWLECIGPRLELVGGLNISGGRPIETKVLAVVDENWEDRIEMTLSIPTTPGTVIRR
jgi:hypothetical protein